LCDLKDSHVQLERRIAGKTLLNRTTDSHGTEPKQ
jgi:hypothetical protein